MTLRILTFHNCTTLHQQEITFQKANCINCILHIKKENNVEPVKLTHWGRVMYICVNDLTIIGSDDGLSPGGRQAIIWTNAGILLIGPLRTNFSEISIKIHAFSFKNIHLKMASAKWRPFCLGLNVLTDWGLMSPAWNERAIFLLISYHYQNRLCHFP